MGSISNPQQPKRVFTLRLKFLILIVYIIGIFIPVQFWRGVWFGRELTDQQLEELFKQESKPRGIQHALVQIDKRIRSKDPKVNRWYRDVATLSSHPLVQIRSEAAWVMGQDNKSSLFHETLLHCLKDINPLVRRNAALALVRFQDLAALEELRAMLKNWQVKSPADGRVELRVKLGQWVNSAVELAIVIREGGHESVVRSDLRGWVLEMRVTDAEIVNRGQVLLDISPDPEHVRESFRALYLIGREDELDLVDAYAQNLEYTEELRSQAHLTAQSIRRRFLKRRQQ